MSSEWKSIGGFHSFFLPSQKHLCNDLGRRRAVKSKAMEGDGPLPRHCLIKPLETIAAWEQGPNELLGHVHSFCHMNNTKHCRLIQNNLRILLLAGLCPCDRKIQGVLSLLLFNYCAS